MYTFTDMQLASISITPEILSLIAEIDEFKGSWRVMGELAPEQLSALKKVATIESIGSSTRIEGSALSDAEVEALLKNLSRQSFSSRDEQEVAGYAELMQLLFSSYEHISVTENYICQLHGELLQHSEKDQWHRGRYKTLNNHVEAFDASGRSLGIVFETASPFETPRRMEQLVHWTRQCMEEKSLHPLIVTAVFVVEFLAIHPFQDGNGRLSRILTTWLLLRAGYTYTPYSSMEALVEQNKEGYYLALRQTQGTLQHAQPNWQPWLLFFLRVLQQQKRRLEVKIEQERLLKKQLLPLSLQILSLATSRGRITVKDIVAFTSANRNTIKKHLEALVQNKQLKKFGVGKGSWYATR